MLHRHRRLLRLRRKRPRGGRAAEQRDEKSRRFIVRRLPCFPTERIAHLSTAGDCCAAGFQFALCRVWVRTDKTHSEHNESALPPKANVGMGQTRSGQSARLSPKVLAISPHTIFKLEQTAGAALNDALLRQIVDNLRRHPKTARQSVG